MEREDATQRTALNNARLTRPSPYGAAGCGAGQTTDREMRQIEQYTVMSGVDGLGGVYEHGGSEQGTYDDLADAVAAADGQPAQWVERLSDGKALAPDGTWV